ncbi:unnamed protein product [Acanthoscelides obtectus]|uniref:Uncharacterized protein n=1 Tax=Acanthoscelides obtectus TaxID=200917 RepID=A0A9P0MK63_ACAOB|nr:unnamed protein product [Acanthoscelides obtectus]CAK1622349.1 hypothetical protein AOBTE_LOCUS1439 [Acanthoscelides obtectus]
MPKMSKTLLLLSRVHQLSHTFRRRRRQLSDLLRINRIYSISGGTCINGTRTIHHHHHHHHQKHTTKTKLPLQ